VGPGRLAPPEQGILLEPEPQWVLAACLNQKRDSTRTGAAAIVIPIIQILIQIQHLKIGVYLLKYATIRKI